MLCEDDAACEEVCDDTGAEETGAEETGVEEAGAEETEDEEELEVDFLAVPGDVVLFAISCADKVSAGCRVVTSDDEVCCIVLPEAEAVPDADEFWEPNMYVPTEFEFLAPALGSTPLLVPEEQLIRNIKVSINKAGKNQRLLFNCPFISYVPHIFIIQK